jgi:hypothetical protein
MELLAFAAIVVVSLLLRAWELQQLATVAQQEVERDWGYRFAFWRRERMRPEYTALVTIKAVHWARKEIPKRGMGAKLSREFLAGYLHEQDFGFIPPWLLAIIIKVVVSLIIDAWFSQVMPITVTPDTIRMALAGLQLLSLKTKNKVDDRVAAFALLVAQNDALMQAAIDAVSNWFKPTFSATAEQNEYADIYEQLAELHKAA